MFAGEYIAILRYNWQIDAALLEAGFYALALRYLAATDPCSSAPNMVQHVLPVMENQPAVIATLLFGALEARLAVLGAALNHSSDWEMPPLEPIKRQRCRHLSSGLKNARRMLAPPLMTRQLPSGHAT